MDIRNRCILVLGGWGLVGTAILRKLVEHQPEKIVILSLKEMEARDTCDIFQKNHPEIDFVPVWGNIFVNKNLKDLSRQDLLTVEKNRNLLLNDTMEALDRSQLETSFLYLVVTEHKPDIIIDTVNTATALAYQDIYGGYRSLKKATTAAIESDRLTPELRAEQEKMLTTLYIPQIIRHVQILYSSMIDNKTSVYLKIGTTGTGGMGLNIPYTHSEERPSRVLLSKAALAGAHTMLLFLMARTPGGPICKEIKPAAAIAWKSIGYGEISKHDMPVRLFDCDLKNAVSLEIGIKGRSFKGYSNLGKTLKSVYIDTGENGTFSLAEFETITTAGQMEFVTPEEIAENAIFEILGDATGRDVLAALDNSIMGPTYRAGYMRHGALTRMEQLEKEHGVDSIAFEILGPPRLSKLLHEANLLKRICNDFRCIQIHGPKLLSEKSVRLIESDQELRAIILSIGIPILLPDGKRILRGPEIKTPAPDEMGDGKITPENINEWARAGWVDLRPENMKLWQERIATILEHANDIPSDDTSSQYHHGRYYWDHDEPIKIGKIAAWIFANEDKGARIKS